MTLFLPAPLNETNADDWKSSLSVATGNLCWVAGNRDTSRHKKCHESPERPSAGSIGNLSMQNSPSGAAQAVLGAKLPRVGTKLARSKSKVCRPRICYSAPQIKSVAIESLTAALRPLCGDEVDKHIAYIAHRAKVGRRVQEVEGIATETDESQLMDDILLRVSIRNVPDHQRRWRHLVINIGVLLNEILGLRHSSVFELLCPVVRAITMLSASEGSMLVRALLLRMAATTPIQGKLLNRLHCRLYTFALHMCGSNVPQHLVLQVAAVRRPQRVHRAAG